jgi:hypothetical protein
VSHLVTSDEGTLHFPFAPAHTFPRARALVSHSAGASVLRCRWRSSAPVKGSPSPSLISFMCCAVAHRTSLAPGPRPRRLAELRPCPLERHPSSPSPPNSTIALSLPSVFSAVASLQGKKVAAPSFSYSPCTLLRSRGEQSPPAASPAMAAATLARPCTCGHGRVCFCSSILLSRLACQIKARSMISLVAAAHRRATVRHRL